MIKLLLGVHMHDNDMERYIHEILHARYIAGNLLL